MTPTAQQQAILDLATTSTSNILISALAGAAKTSTLVLLAEALPVKTLCIAFNKRIAVEMQARLPAHCEARTLNSLGHTTWAANIGKRLQIDDRKTYRLTKQAIEEIADPKEKSQAYEMMADLMRAIDGGKTAGYIPDAWKGPMKPSPLMNDTDMFEWLEEAPSALAEDLIRTVSMRSLDEAFGRKGGPILDYNDQLLMPTIFPVSFAISPLVMVDEAQDLSALNHVMLSKFAKKRLIAVGDECQSIYGFRGAHEESMALLEQQFSMKRMILSISFRCPIEIVKAAQWRAPHMRWPDWAIEGEVRRPGPWKAEALPDDAVILCRNNAPLFSTAIRLLKNGRYPELVGNDIGKMLVKLLKKLGDESLPQAQVLLAISEWEDAKLKKSRSPGKVRDQADCLRIFANQGKTLGEAMAYATDIMNRSGPIKLMTGHKAKGLEWPNVFMLDEDLIKGDQQDKNLRYVMITRAKETLTYIYSADFLGNEEDAE